MSSAVKLAEVTANGSFKGFSSWSDSFDEFKSIK